MTKIEAWKWMGVDRGKLIEKLEDWKIKKLKKLITAAKGIETRFSRLL